MNIPKEQQVSSWTVEGDLAIESLMEKYYSDISRLALAMLGDHEDAKDAAQETFIRAGANLEQFRGDSEIKTWLYAIALNVCRNELRKRKTRQSLINTLRLFGLINRHSNSIEEKAIVDDETDRLWKEVLKLDEKHRIPVILRYFERMSVPEIAKVLNAREGTIHSRLHYARQKLAEKLERDLE
jgi:RNA polymerase sigma-70 factor, ECF subfamily